MSLKAEVSLLWGGEERLFALKAKQIENLEADCGEGIGRIAARVFAKIDFSYKHVRRTIFWALIGGGMNPTDAAKLISAYVDDCPIDPVGDPSSNLKTASAILQAVYFGWEDLPEPGEAGAGVTPASEPISASTEPHSSGTA